MSDLLLQAVNARQNGNIALTKQLLAQALIQDPRNEGAWMLMYEVVDDVKLKRNCLERVLAINPDNSHQVGEIGQHHVVLQRERDGLGRRPGPLQFVDDDRVVAEVVDARAAEVFGNRKAEQPKLSRFDEQRAVPLALLFAVLMPGYHGLAHEIAHHLPELVMLLGVFQTCGHLVLPSAEGVAAGERLAEDELVHLGRALVSEHRLQVDHVPDDRVFQRYAVAAQYGSSGPADLDGLPGVVQLAEADLLGTQPDAVLEATQVQRQQLTLVQFDRHVDELCLGQLESGDRAPELGALRRVVERRLPGRPRRAHRTPDDAVARLGQAGQRSPQAFRLGQHRVGGQPHVVEHQLAGDRGPQRQLVVDGVGGKPRCPGGDDEAANAVVGGGPHDRDVGDRAVGDPQSCGR